MKLILALIFTVLMANTAFAGEKKNCKKGYEKVSCEEVLDAKRKSFCWKGKMTEEKKVKLCQKDRKKFSKKKSKKTMVKKS